MAPPNLLLLAAAAAGMYQMPAAIPRTTASQRFCFVHRGTHTHRISVTAAYFSPLHAITECAIQRTCASNEKQPEPYRIQTQRAVSKAVVMLARSTPGSSVVDDQRRIARRKQQKQEEKRGAFLLSTVMAVTIWLFSLPPYIRRIKICTTQQALEQSYSNCTTLSTLWEAITSHYKTCGANGQPCVNFDFSIDPESVETFNAVMDFVLKNNS
eukprot:2223666-Pleurochrysis_carterae.AAC.2